MTVDEYIGNASAERQPALKKIRSICQRILAGYEECIEYGMPSYKRDGEVEIAFANQKQNIALYILKKSVMDVHRDRFPKSSIGKGCIRYRNPEKIDFVVIEQMIQESYKSDDRVC